MQLYTLEFSPITRKRKLVARESVYIRQLQTLGISVMLSLRRVFDDGVNHNTGTLLDLVKIQMQGLNFTPRCIQQ
jgi:hypothetical protein